MRPAAVVMLNSVLVFAIYSSATEARSQAVSDQSSPQLSQHLPKIEVRVSPIKRSVVWGEPMLVRVELRNIGDEPIFVPAKVPLNSWGDPGNLDVFLSGVNDHGFGRIEGGGDIGRPSREDFYKLVLKNWVVLFPEYSYGNTVDVRSAFWGTPKPGRYRLTAKYSAFGMGSRDMNNPLGAYLDRVPSLPYVSWEGEVECKPVWLEIAPATRHTKNSN